MTIVGFNFTRISAEKSKSIHGKISIGNNVTIKNVEDAQLAMADTKKSVRVHFSFMSKYEPEIGKLELEGNVILLESAKVGEDLLKHWGKNKSLPKPLLSGVLNHVLDRCNIQALILARDLGLPAPIPLPKVNVQQEGSPQKAAAKPAPKKKK